MHARIIVSSFLILTAYFLTPLILNTKIHAQTPPSPKGPHVLCLSGQAAVRLNWFPVEGATGYQVRLDADAPSWDGACTNPDTCTTTNASEITLPIVPGKKYDWWVHAVNGQGWSQPAMDGVAFSCEIPVPSNLYYRCLPDNTLEMRWQDTNTAGLYEISLDAKAPSWDGSCESPDRCMSVNRNIVTAQIDPTVEYEFWVRAKDNKGNKSDSSTKMEISCNQSLPASTTPSLTEIPVPTITSPSPSPTTVSPSPQTPSPSEPPISAQECSKRPLGDANCDGIIDLRDEQCWARMFSINFLEVGSGCKYTNFDEEDGTNILDFAIWYVNREA